MSNEVQQELNPRFRAYAWAHSEKHPSAMLSRDARDGTPEMWRFSEWLQSRRREYFASQLWPRDKVTSVEEEEHFTSWLYLYATDWTSKDEPCTCHRDSD